jgi:hypothetical protein
MVFAFGISAVLPKAEGATSTSLPPLQTVIQRVMETSADENTEYHIFNQHYFYTRDRVTDFRDGSGTLKEHEEKWSTNNPVHAVVMTRPRPPLRPATFKKQDAGPSIHGVSLGKKEDLINPDLLKRYTLTMVGREMLNGRPALVVDFKPASNDLPIFNIKDRFLNCVAGRAWVDEADFTLEKVELHLTQKVTVLGGIVGSVSKFTFSFDRERTPDGYWFTRDMDWHLEAHEATIPRVVDHHEKVTDLQKMP